MCKNDIFKHYGYVVGGSPNDFVNTFVTDARLNNINGTDNSGDSSRRVTDV